MVNTLVLDKCYEYRIILCEEVYIFPAYLIEGDDIYFVMNQPVDPDPEQADCIKNYGFEWSLVLKYAENYPSIGQFSWLLVDATGQFLAYTPASNPSTLPTAPYSEWSIFEGSDGEFIDGFFISETGCPDTSCDCTISVSIDILNGETTTNYVLDGQPVGMFGGKTLYKIFGTIYGDLAVYWDYVNNQWAIDYWDNIYATPSIEPPVYLISTDGCPNGTYLNNPLYEEPLPLQNAVVSLQDCYTYPNVSEYCCVNIGFSNGIDVLQYSVELIMSYWPGLGIIPMYQFSIDTEYFRIIFNSLTYRWEIYNIPQTEDPVILIAYAESISDICPISSFTDWQITEDGYKLIGSIDKSDPDHPYDSLYIYGCETVEIILPGDHDAINCDPYIPCHNNQTLKRSSAVLSKEIASISKREVFGFNCDDAWNTIFMKNSIIHALSCLPYGFYSEADEQCLIGKLNDKCNC